MKVQVVLIEALDDVVTIETLDSPEEALSRAETWLGPWDLRATIDWLDLDGKQEGLKVEEALRAVRGKVEQGAGVAIKTRMRAVIFRPE